MDELLRLLALDADPNAREDEPGATDDPEALILAASVPNSLAKARAVSVLITAGADPRATSGTEFNNRSLPIHAGRNSDAAEQAAQMVRLLRHFIAALGETANDSPPGPNYDWNYDGGSFGQALKWVRNYCAVNDAPDACGELAALMYERGSRCAGGREGAEDGALCEVPVENIARALPRDFNAPVATVAARDFGRARFDLALPDAEKLLELQSGGWTLALNESRPQQIVLSRTVPVAGGEVALFTIAAMLAGESEVVREYRASVAGPSPDDLLVAEAAQTVSAPDLAEVRRLLNDESADPDATNENGVPVMLIAAANLHAEMVSVLVTAGADVSVSHSLLDGLPLPHLMAANECSGTEPEQIPARGWPESLEVLQHFHNAASLSGQPYDHRREVGGFAAVELLDDSYANCTPDDNVDGDAILRMRNILLYDPDGGGVYCDADDIICYATRFVDFPAQSELAGGALSVFIVAVDESETAIDPGEEADNRFSIRFVAVPETGLHPVWSEDCEAVVPGATRCDLPRSADDLTVSVAFADSAALASALLLREVLKEPPLAPEPASVVALLDRGADPNLMIEDNHILPVVVFRRSGDAADSFARAEVVSILITAGANPRGALAVGGDVPFIVAFQSEELSGLQSGLSILRRFIGGMGRRLQSHPDDAPDYDWTRAVGNATVPQVLRDYCDAENDPATCREMADLLYEPRRAMRSRRRRPLLVRAPARLHASARDSGRKRSGRHRHRPRLRTGTVRLATPRRGSPRVAFGDGMDSRAGRKPPAKNCSVVRRAGFRFGAVHRHRFLNEHRCRARNRNRRARRVLQPARLPIHAARFRRNFKSGRRRRSDQRRRRPSGQSIRRLRRRTRPRLPRPRNGAATARNAAKPAGRKAAARELAKSPRPTPTTKSPPPSSFIKSARPRCRDSDSTTADCIPMFPRSAIRCPRLRRREPLSARRLAELIFPPTGAARFGTSRFRTTMSTIPTRLCNPASATRNATNILKRGEHAAPIERRWTTTCNATLHAPQSGEPTAFKVPE